MISEIIILFGLYSLFGWAFESAYCSIRSKKVINRGFLFGPLCPIYGFGSLLIILVLTPVIHSPLLVYLFSVLLTSIFEYAVSLLLEVLFKKSWWDYSNQKLNINGRVWLVASAAWGFLALFLVCLLHPQILRLIRILSEPVKWIIAVALIAGVLTDLTFSVRNTVMFNREMKRLSELSARIDRLKDELLKYGTTKRDEWMAAGIEKKEQLEQELTVLLSQRETFATVFMARMNRIFDAFPKIKLNHKDKVSLRERLLSFRKDR